MTAAAEPVALIQGMMLGASICFTLGPQSLFVLRQGIHGEQAFRIAAICTAADLLLIAAAAAGANAIVMSFPEAIRFGAWGGAIFTLAFGCLALMTAFRPRPAEAQGTGSPRAIRAALALCFLNPQVYFEMVAIVGGVSLHFAPTERTIFALGVGLISPLWFFGLALGGRKLSVLFNCRGAQRALDAATGLAMLGLAMSIFASEMDHL